MAERWVRDMNRNILRNGRHWTDDPPNDYDPNRPHPVHRENMSHNILMNLFKRSNDTDDRHSTTFRSYYMGTISETLTKFASRLTTLPRVARGADDREKPQRDRIDAAFNHLNDAANKPGADTLQMKHLYLYSEIDFERDQLDSIQADIKAFREQLTWVCVPFLKFWEPGIHPRPIEDDLTIHLDGGIYDGRTVMGFGNYDYEGMLFFNYGSDDRLAREHFWARKFAIDKHFFDNERVYDRVVRELSDAQNASHIDPMRRKSENVVQGGGNGYCCVIEGGVRKCKPGDPVDYCVNNGSTICGEYAC